MITCPSPPGEYREREHKMEPGLKLRQDLESTEITLVACIQDAMTAKLAEVAGLPAAILGSGNVTNTLLGLPDSGFLTLTEMEFILSRTVAACEIPILIDADAGYGNAINVVRTVRTLERAGAAGIFFEDQEDPPRCGLVTGHILVSPAEMVGKVKAAVDSRRNDSFIVIARTDAWSIEGLGSAIERGQQYVEAGADAVFVNGLLSVEEKQKVTKGIPGSFHLATLTGAAEPRPTVGQLQSIGFNAVVPGAGPLTAGALTTLRYMVELQKGIDPNTKFREEAAGTPLEEWFKFTGFDWVRELEERYLPADLMVRRYEKAQPGFYENRATQRTE